MQKRSFVLGLIVALAALLSLSILGATGPASAGDNIQQSDYKCIQ